MKWFNMNSFIANIITLDHPLTYKKRQRNRIQSQHSVGMHQHILFVTQHDRMTAQLTALIHLRAGDRLVQCIRCLHANIRIRSRTRSTSSGEQSFSEAVGVNNWIVIQLVVAVAVAIIIIRCR